MSDERHPRFDEEPEELDTLFNARKDDEGPEPEFVLRVVQGVDRGNSLVVSADAPRALIGTGPTSVLRLTDRQVSRRHIAVEARGARLHVTDLESTNGTWIASIRVQEVSLGGGEAITIGETVLAVERGPEAPRSLPNGSNFGATLGASTEMRRLFPLLARLAAANVPVIIEGETGTGKEVLAESLHSESPRAKSPFIVFDCTAVPPNLLESELFGHERGAFTGAVSQRKGVFEQAHGGTLLIDEIGDLDLALQPKLLRALERSEIRRVGGDRWLKVDVRVVAATRRDLDREVAEGRFRDDLYHRLAVGRVELPPLRKRKSDIPLLAQRFALELGGDPSRLPPAVVASWQEHAWPGNVRELRNVVARQLALGELANLTFPDAKAQSDHAAEPNATDGWVEEVLAKRLPLIEARELVLAEFERRYIDRILEFTGGNVARAAAHAGIARRYFQILKAKRRA